MSVLDVCFGTIDRDLPGGIPPAEAAFVSAGEREGLWRASHIAYGRRAGAPRWRRGFELPGDWLGYASRVARQRPDVVHLNSAYDRRALQRDLGYALISRLLGQPLFLKFHGSDADLLERPSPLWRWMTARVLSGASAVGVLSGDERRRFAALWPAVRFEQVRNAVSCDRFAGPRAAPGEVPELLFIARLVPAKGLRDCIRATRLLLDQGRRVRLVVVGDGPDRGPGESLARELALGDAVRFVGRVPESEATDFYLRASMLVLPTAHGEGFSMTIFQSLAAGLPILTTRIRAAADWLREPDHCLWVEAGQPVPLAERIAWLLDHPEVAARMSEAGRRHARGFDAGPVAREYAGIYRSIARSAARGSRAPGAAARGEEGA